jgi:hypothetical protein
MCISLGFFLSRRPCVTVLFWIWPFLTCVVVADPSKHMTWELLILFLALSVALFRSFAHWIIEPADVFFSQQTNKKDYCLNFAEHGGTTDFWNCNKKLWESKTIMEARSIPSARTGRRTWGGSRLHPAPTSHGMLHRLPCLPPWPRCSREGHRLQPQLPPSLPASAAAASYPLRVARKKKMRSSSLVQALFMGSSSRAPAASVCMSPKKIYPDWLRWLAMETSLLVGTCPGILRNVHITNEHIF